MMEGHNNRPTQLLPKEDVAVVIWGNKITNNISYSIRFQASKEVARKYLGNNKKNLWPNKQFNKVNWEHLDLALKNKPDVGMLAAACKAFSLANVKGTGTNDWVIRSLDD
jgi:hypothetical protein